MPQRAGPHQLAAVALLRPAAGLAPRARPAAGDGEGLEAAAEEELALEIERELSLAAAPRQPLAGLRRRYVHAQQQDGLVLAQQSPRLLRPRRDRRAREPP